MQFDFHSDAVMVTGAARGLGLAVARAFSEAGARVAMADLDEARVREAAAALGERTLPLAMDVTDERAVERAFAAITAAWRGVSVLVNNAGIVTTTTFTDLATEEWQRIVQVNLTGAFLCMKAAVPAMIRNGRGAIVNIGSIAGRNGGYLASAAYSASKAGIAGLTKAAARQLAAHGIRVNCVAPSAMRTEMTEGWGEAKLEGLRKDVPLGRLAEVVDTASAVLYLASPAASFITGVTLDVNGGSYMAP